MKTEVGNIYIGGPLQGQPPSSRMATYRSTSPLQVQVDLFADTEKYQPIEFDKKHPPNTSLQFLVLISNLVLLILLLAGAGCATRGEEAVVDFPQVGKKKYSFDQFFDFLKRIIHTRLCLPIFNIFVFQYEEQAVFYPAKRSLTKLTDP